MLDFAAYPTIYIQEAGVHSVTPVTTPTRDVTPTVHFYITVGRRRLNLNQFKISFSVWSRGTNPHDDVLLWFLSVPGYGLLAAAPVEANVRRWEGGARARGAGLVTVRGGAVALIRRHTVTAVAVEPYGKKKRQQRE